MTGWRNLDRPLILASQSPRRKELLTRMGFSFTVDVPQGIDEAAFFESGDFRSAVRGAAEAKAFAIARSHAGALVLAADTIVVCDTTVLGKPRHARDAAAMIRRLSGRTHLVLTAVALVCGERDFRMSLTEETTVRFRSIDKEELADYLDRGDYQDKAGAYGIQGAAMTLVERIEGCFYNVVGLPVKATIMLFEQYARGKGSTNA